MFLKNPQNWKVFNSIYFSPRVNISFQLQFTRSYFWIWKIWFHIASALFSLSINYNFVRTKENSDTFTSLGSKKQKAPHLFQPPTYNISLNFTNPLFIKTPSPFIWELRVHKNICSGNFGKFSREQPWWGPVLIKLQGLYMYWNRTRPQLLSWEFSKICRTVTPLPVKSCFRN